MGLNEPKKSPIFFTLKSYCFKKLFWSKNWNSRGFKINFVSGDNALDIFHTHG